MLSGFGAWHASFLFGLLSIVWFAQDRLNQRLPSDGDDPQRRERLIELVLPFQLRNQRVFRRAYLVYTGILVVIYAVGSIFGSVIGPVLFPGTDVNGPEWPMALALAMIGIAPKFPVLLRLEEKIRAFTHELVGVPRTFHSFTNALLNVPVSVETLGDDLIAPGDAQRLALVLEAAARVMGRTMAHETFSNRTVKLFAFRAWNDSDLAWPPYSVRREFRRIEAEVTPAVHGLIEDLEHLAGLTLAQSPTDADAQQNWVAMESRWRSIAQRVGGSADDVCALFALYAERATEPPVKDNPISALLRDLIEEAQAARERADPGADALLIAVGLVGLTGFAIGFIGALAGITAPPGSQPWRPAFFYLMGVLILYGPTAFLAWDSRHPSTAQGWINPFADTRIFPARQFLGLFVKAYLLSFLIMSLFMMLHVVLATLGQRDPEGPALFGVLLGQFFGTGQPVTCGTGALIWVAAATATLGGWNAVHLALHADASEAELDDGPARMRLVASHALGLGAIQFVTSVSLGRLHPCTDAVATVAPHLGLALNAAEELLVFEVLTSTVLGLIFAWQARAAFRALRIRETAAADALTVG